MKKQLIKSLVLISFIGLVSSCSKNETAEESRWLTKTVKYMANDELYNVKVHFKENGSDFKFDESTPKKLLDFLDKNSKSLSVALKGDIAYYYSDFSEMSKAQNINIDFNEIKKHHSSKIEMSNLKRAGGGNVTVMNHTLEHYRYNPYDYQSAGRISYTIGSKAAGGVGSYFVNNVEGKFNDQITTIDHQNSFSNTVQITFCFADANYGGNGMALISTSHIQIWDLRAIHRTNLPWAWNWNDCISSMFGHHIN